MSLYEIRRRIGEVENDVDRARDEIAELERGSQAA